MSHYHRFKMDYKSLKNQKFGHQNRSLPTKSFNFKISFSKKFCFFHLGYSFLKYHKGNQNISGILSFLLGWHTLGNLKNNVEENHRLFCKIRKLIRIQNMAFNKTVIMNAKMYIYIYCIGYFRSYFIFKK